MRLLKYHGLGNDFLILLDHDGSQPVDGLMARAVCDRHRGVGADGLIRVSGLPDHPVMELYNADGGRAETSGNGLRCVARALVDAGLARGEVVIGTDGGPRTAVIHAADPNGGEGGVVTVDLTPATPPVVVEGAPRVAHVTLDNPHVVLAVGDPSTIALVDLAALATPFGEVNVEAVAAGPGADELTMRVWERGVGETQACGSGSCAAALAARHWGVGGDQVTVLQPGGALRVDLSGGRVRLTGPTTYVAAVEVEP